MVRNEYNTNLKELDIHDLKCPAQDKDVTHPDQILTPDEIVSLIGACTWSRDRAIIAVHYEAATRIGELARLRWRDILWDEYGATIVITDTKTNKVRRSRITKSISATYLATWRDDYIGTPEGDNLVFISSRGTPITYRIITRVFQSAADTAGVKKRVNTHVFRKSRGTHLIEQGLPLPNLMEMMWANQGTRQIRTYVRLSPGEQDRVMLRHAGVITDEESKQQEHRITARLCPECHYENIPTAKYCNSCGLALEEGSRNLQKKLVNPDDPEDLINKMREMIRIHDLEKI
jgi:integrase